MQDKMKTLATMLTKNDVIHQHTYDSKTKKHRLFFYTNPENTDLKKPFIIIEPIGPTLDTVYGSNQPLLTQFIYQIDVQSTDRLTCKEIQRAIKETLLKIDFFQQSGGLDEYFNETGRFVDARRYKGNSKLYDTDY
ncbi:hypothetical protein ACWOAH_10495 [Vagococcus vulneris]|uniref:Phage protein n=1 Tax=Vagococcus vulneris TaxID=1977869 RepID=A0A429ZTF8_9ENTE|nr:hypothetical protein [Vagococcus vulneris]RST96944.1 hypothetical protein CBF37_10325 [Vagococcus vulneris]